MLWQVAVLIVAITFLMVNAVQVIISLKIMTKYSGVLDKSVKVLEKSVDVADKTIDNYYEDL